MWTSQQRRQAYQLIKRCETICDKQRNVEAGCFSQSRVNQSRFQLNPCWIILQRHLQIKEARRAAVPGKFGGNMDYQGMVEGALLFLGDGHAKQRYGELVNSGIEISMDVEFKVDLIKGMKITWP